ncbi:hypothetical protein PsorP6_006045 [Peronosclerospora sorghi]|uniref:Uncharacterized protein n=1 Tax=Peronosclerospora sorghi TaxID=230839 RepID=A0ACC0W7E1_9STRA|nr:hypothetical protein PsorP6_006045 [Peronosclerospora sorghi]
MRYPVGRRQLYLRRFLVFLIVFGSFTFLLQILSLLGRPDDGWISTAKLRKALNLPVPSRDELEINFTEASGEDLLHLSLLHERCVSDVDSVLPWHFGSPGHQFSNATASNPEVVAHRNDSDLLLRLKTCPDIDIFLPKGLHGSGYCEDAVAYANAKSCPLTDVILLPMWALQVKMFDPELGKEVDYFDLCPKTPMIFFNHYWDGVPSMSRWPNEKPIYLMPNIEMIELTPEHYWRADAVLCKTQECFHRVTMWYKQEGNPRNTPVFYTKHTSSNQAYFARSRLGEDAIAPKNFSTVKFLHTPGVSNWKGTRTVLDCWTSIAGLPPLEVYLGEKLYKRIPLQIRERLTDSSSPVHVHVGTVESLQFAKIIAEGSFFLCPSLSEGYGHYLNQARASGGVIVTTNVPPMNELIPSSKVGVLVSASRRANTLVLLGGDFNGERGLNNLDGLMASITALELHHAVLDMVNSTTPEQRAAIAANARRQYHEDTKFFAKAMQDLRKFSKTDKEEMRGGFWPFN